MSVSPNTEEFTDEISAYDGCSYPAHTMTAIIGTIADPVTAVAAICAVVLSMVMFLPIIGHSRIYLPYVDLQKIVIRY